MGSLNAKTVNSRNHVLNLYDPEIGPLSDAITLGQTGPGSDGNEEVLHIPQSSSFTLNLTIRLLSFISRTLLGGVSYLSTEMQSVYSTAQLGHNILGSNMLNFTFCFIDF